MKNINLEVKKTFKVGDREFDSKDEALKAMAMEVLETEIPKGIDSVVENAAKIIQALRVINK